MGEPAMVLENARPHLRALTKLAAELNEASDQYTVELRYIEEELNKLNLGLEVTLPEAVGESEKQAGTQGEEDEARQIWSYDEWRLGYGKLNSGGWGLLLKRYSVVLDPARQHQEESFEEAVPLLQASRDLRIDAAEGIPRLLNALREVAETKIAALKKVSDGTRVRMVQIDPDGAERVLEIE